MFFVVPPLPSPAQYSPTQFVTSPFLMCVFIATPFRHPYSKLTTHCNFPSCMTLTNPPPCLLTPTVQYTTLSFPHFFPATRNILLFPSSTLFPLHLCSLQPHLIPSPLQYPLCPLTSNAKPLHPLPPTRFSSPFHPLPRYCHLSLVA